MTEALDVTAVFPLFAPNSAGKRRLRERLTVGAINDLAPRLRSLIGSLGGAIAEPVDIRRFPASAAGMEAAEELKRLFDACGSDKASSHDYHRLYGHILQDREAVRGIVEIGLGTNNGSFVSYMGAGAPGGSLRAFRDFCPHAMVYGADIDREILFEEDRIATFFVDQTDVATLEHLAGRLPDELDLVIDDGLHAPHANLATLEFGLKKIRPGGWVVIEDIAASAVDLWACVPALLPAAFQAQLLQARRGMLFAVTRVG
jgi:hypothetical protein